MATSARRFSARQTDIVVDGVGSELLIFDRQTDTAHCLAEAAALVWRSCEGGATLSELAEMLVAHNLAGSPHDAATLAEAALSELAEKGLLETSFAPEGMPRRQALRRIAGVGAAAVGAPLIVSAGLPTSAFAAVSTPCITNGDHCLASGGPSNCCADLYCDYSSGGQLTCHDCYASGSKPRGDNCSSYNSFRCCSGACGTGVNADFCA